MAIRNLFPEINPTLNLDFANTRQLDPRITFSRATSGTYYDGRTFAKAEENLLTYSQEFDNGAWSRDTSSVTPNATTAPDGTSTADLLYASSGTSFHSIYRDFAAGTYTLSVYAKAAGFDFIRLRLRDSSGAGLNYAFFNLSSGTVGTTDSTASIQSVGGGWYRCIITDTISATAAGVAINLASADGVVEFANSGTSGVYLWGAQLEKRSAVTAYTPTTSQPITNYIPAMMTALANVARFDHDPVTGESFGLKISQQSSNIFLNSETPATQSITVTAVAHTLSFYGDGTITLSGGYSSTVVGDGDYPARKTVTFIPSAGSLTCTISGDVQMVQLETGATATSYIPTGASAVTRAADAASMTGANFSSWLRPGSGTLVVDLTPLALSSGAGITLSDGTASNRIRLAATSAAEQASITVGGVVQATLNGGTPVAGVMLRMALSWDTNHFGLSVNGGEVVADTLGTVPVLTQMQIGTDISTAGNALIRSVRYYPAALPSYLRALSA